MKSITETGFYKMYFDQLKTSNTKLDAFNVVNNNVKTLTGKKMFSSYYEFKYTLFG